MATSASPPYVLGLDLGGTSVKAVALDKPGRELTRDTQPFNLDTHMAFAEAVGRVVSRIEQRLASRPMGIGLSAPGLPAADERCVAFMPGRFPGLVGFDWAGFLQREHVPVLNDARAALLGEVWQGAARGSRDVVLLTLGTGVGGAAMVDGQVLRGASGKAGHLGHVSLDPDGPLDITGTPGSLEDAIGNHNIAARSKGRFQTTHDLVSASEAGDPLAREVWQRSIRALAAALASFTNVLDPEVIIVGGGVARCGDALFAPLRELVRRYEWNVGARAVRTVPAELGELAGAYGAAYRALAVSIEKPG